MTTERPAGLLLPLANAFRDFRTNASDFEEQEYSHEDLLETLIDAAILPKDGGFVEEAIQHFVSKHDSDASIADRHIRSLSEQIVSAIDALGLRTQDGSFPYYIKTNDNGLVVMNLNPHAS